MQRIAFQLKIRAGQESAYDEAHKHVWPELLEELASFGVSQYSVFRRGQDLFLTLRVPDRDELMRQLAQSDVNQRWQRYMAPILEPLATLREGETAAFMEEVFYTPGAPDLGR